MIKIKNLIKHVKIQAFQYGVKGENSLLSTTFATSTWLSLSVMMQLFLTVFSRKNGETEKYIDYFNPKTWP